MFEYVFCMAFCFVQLEISYLIRPSLWNNKLTYLLYSIIIIIIIIVAHF